MSGSFAFVKAGSFSHTNDRVLNELQRNFPEFKADVFDVSGSEEFKVSSLRSVVEVAREYGLLSCLTAESYRRRKLRTAYYFRALRKLLLRRLRSKRYVFTFQTQSFFDSSTPESPHFVYTDHSHLANLTYPYFAHADLSSVAWIAREQGIYRNAVANLTMSTNISRSLIDQYGCDPGRVHCVYAGHHMDAVDMNSLPFARFKNKNILFVGVEWERKGGPVLLEAFRRVRLVHPSAQLTIVGCNPQIDMPGCRVVGRVPLAQVADFYRSASVFCLPTRIEPFGIVLLEAFSYGLPIVATNIGAIPDFVTDAVSGYLVPPDDATVLADRLSHLLAHPSTCAEFGKRGHDLVRERYTWNATGLRIASHIKQYTFIP